MGTSSSTKKRGAPVPAPQRTHPARTTRGAGAYTFSGAQVRAYPMSIYEQAASIQRANLPLGFRRIELSAAKPDADTAARIASMERNIDIARGLAVALVTGVGAVLVLHPLDMVSVARDQLGECVGSLAEHGQEIADALDELLTRSWH